MKSVYAYLLKPLGIIIASLLSTTYFNLRGIIPLIPKNDFSINISIYSVLFSAIPNYIELKLKKEKISIELYLNNDKTFINKDNESKNIKGKTPAKIYAKIHCNDIEKINRLNIDINISLKIPKFLDASCEDRVPSEKRELIIDKLNGTNHIVPISVSTNSSEKDITNNLQLYIDCKDKRKVKRNFDVKRNVMKVKV